MVKQGYSAEYERKKQLEKNGCIVFRVSGSVGEADLVVIKKFKSVVHPKVFEVWLEQIKSTKKNVFYFDEKSKDEWKRLRNCVLDSYFVVKFRRGRGRRVLWKKIKVCDKRPNKISI